MRTRDKQIILRLTEKEYDELKANVAKTSLSMQAYLRTIIAGTQPKERVPMNLIETLRNLNRIGINLNQLAWEAHSLNFIDTKAYWENVEMTKDAIRIVMEEIRR